MLHYLNGKWVTKENLLVSAFDISVLRGFGIFDFLRTYKQKPFRLIPHIERLFNSARVMDMTIPMTKEELEKIILQGIEQNAHEVKEFNIRIVVTGGLSADSISIGEPSVIVMYVEAHDYPEEYYSKGIKVTTIPIPRVLYDAKTLNYMVGVLELKKAREKGAIEIIHTNPNGVMYEGMTSNFMAVINGEVVTPAEGILQGITKQVIKEITNKLSIPYSERKILKEEIHSFEEAFITASNKEVMPVIQIDDKVIGTGKVGPITNKIITEYRNMTRG